MNVVEYKVKKIVLTPEEQMIKKSWGKYWAEIKHFQDIQGYFYLIIGEWSGYNSLQKKDVHIDICTNGIKKVKSASYIHLGIIEYTDKTVLDVRAEKYTLERLLKEKLSRKPSYTDLIKSLIKSNTQYYRVS